MMETFWGYGLQNGETQKNAVDFQSQKCYIVKKE